jgi:hypothetical protein
MHLAEMKEAKMTRIVVQSEVAEQIRQSDGPIELVDDQGHRVGMVRRPPTEQEIEFAKARIGKKGPKFTIEEVIAKIEAL